MADRDDKGMFVKGHKSFVKKGMHKGKRHSPATEFKKGMKPWNYKGAVELKCHSCNEVYSAKPYRADTSKFCSNECRWAGVKIDPWKNKAVRSHSQEARARISKHQRENPRRGKDNWNWKGGHRTERKQSMGRYEYKEWRLAVFERDNYTCVICEATGTILHADHIKRWENHPELRYEVDNGRTVCRACHYYITFKKKMPSASKWGMSGVPMEAVK